MSDDDVALQTSDPDPVSVSDSFPFSLRSDEAVSERIVRCCEEALADGPMGENDRHDFYGEFIACGQEKTV